MKDLQQQLLDLCYLIEKIPAGEQQTAASVAANDLLRQVQEPLPPTEQTLGERIVRMRFNPSKTGLVDQLKQKHARLIDIVHEIIHPMDLDDIDAGLLMSNKQAAIDHLEVASMYAVKVATAGK